MVLLFDERIFEMTAQQPEDHIKNPYTLAEIKTKIASNDYNAEMLLQHAMLLLDGAALSANVGEPVAWYEYNESLDTWFLAYNHNPKAKTRPLVFGDGTNNLRDRKPDTQTAPAAQVDAEDAARYRWLRSQASEKLLNPRAALSEICPDMRTHWKLPTLICSGPVGGYLDFDAAIDAARSQDKEGENHA